MKTVHRNEAFICAACEQAIPPAKGTCRDHCTACLTSLHVDAILPGDRASTCGGLFVPQYAQIHSKKGIMIHYCCAKCGALHHNRAAEDDDSVALDALIIAANIRATEAQ